MRRLILANSDYSNHMTDEGDQLQRGLEAAGWILAGAGFADDCKDVPTLLGRHRPDVVFVQDKRDWSPDSPGAFRKDIGFERLDALAASPAFKVAVVKDAGTTVDYQRRFCEEICADAVVTYYHDAVVLAGSPYLAGYGRIRTYHTVNSRDVCEINLRQQRRRGVVSGAIGGYYPLREFAVNNQENLGLEWIRHPGYGNAGSFTRRYLHTLAQFKTHLATTSVFHFALRKIIESVAVGCTPITNLPFEDKLPGIDGALVRVPDDITLDELRDVIDEAENAWDMKQRIHWATVACEIYDFRQMGARLSWQIIRAVHERNSVHV